VITRRLWNLRNVLDFSLRRLAPWPLLKAPITFSAQDKALGDEVLSFISLFHWPDKTSKSPARPVVVDIGCRTFFLAPALDRFFRELGYQPEIHGVEIDAFRRMRDFRTRKEWGDFFASTISNGNFHAMDFLQWEKPVDFALLLNPFVLERSVLAWGLPLRFLQPEALLRKCKDQMVPGGRLLISAPTAKELAESVRLAARVGFKKLQTANWQPTESSIQTRPRLGVLFENPV
jgi:SAM-dependent methyltransferase